MRNTCAVMCSLLVVVVSLTLLAMGGECPCRVYSQELAFPAPLGNEFHLGSDGEILDVDSSLPSWIRHGFGGPRFEYFDSMDEASICAFVRENWRFELFVDGVAVEPTQLVAYPLFSDWECGPWVFYWVFEFPAEYFLEGMRVFQGHWLRQPKALEEQDYCPELLASRGKTFEELIVETWRTQFVRYGSGV